MTLLLIAAMIYAVLAFAGSQFLLALSAPAFALLVYIFPLILNFLVTKMQKNDTQKLIASLVSPILTVLFYVGFVSLSLSSGAWSKFVEANNVANSSIILEITTTPLDASQLIFFSLVFFGISLATYFISKASLSKNRGVQHA